MRTLLARLATWLHGGGLDVVIQTGPRHDPRQDRFRFRLWPGDTIQLTDAAGYLGRLELISHHHVVIELESDRDEARAKAGA